MATPSADTPSIGEEQYGKLSSIQEDEETASNRQSQVQERYSAERNSEEKERESSPIIAKIPLTASNEPKVKSGVKTWPGALALILLLAGMVVSLVMYGIQKHNNIKNGPSVMTAPASGAQGRGIRDSIATIGSDGKPSNDTVDAAELNPEVVNPASYPDKGCILPNYESKSSGIHMTTPDGRTRSIDIKGVNWVGFETSDAIPYGLWTKDGVDDGTTLYEIGKFLQRQKFNSVRFPLCVQSILINLRPNAALINTYNNKALDPRGYLTLLKGIIKGLGYWGISVLLDLHRLTPSTPDSTSPDDLWYSDAVPESDVLKAIDMLTTDLCNGQYWNVIGVDLKNAPDRASWGDGSKTDWQLGAQRLGNQVLKGCSNWLVFVQGIRAKRSITFKGNKVYYYDWPGGGLQDVGDAPIKLKIDNKLVWAPHYYNPSVYPEPYFYAPGSFSEISDSDLASVVRSTMSSMFGYLNSTGSAIILGEFGGLYSTDANPLKTNQRVTNYVMQTLVKEQSTYSGGYLWSLNPEQSYPYNTNELKSSQYGLLKSTWVDVNVDYLKALTAMDSYNSLDSFTCYPKLNVTLSTGGTAAKNSSRRI